MKKFAVIGNPINHSLSPLLHNWIFEKLKINAIYEKIKLEAEDLNKIVSRINNGELDGVNVTIPYKEKIIELLDEVNARSKLIGSVNMILRSNNKSYGNNTDWYGFSLALKSNQIKIINKEVIVLGCGGASKAVIFSLKNDGVKKINLINRTFNKAKSLEDDIVSAYSINDINKVIEKNSIIINTTSVGMKNNQTPVSLDLIHENQTLIDIIYNPLYSPLLKFGKDIGAKTLNGLDMFIYQGLASLDLWFGKSISKQVNLNEIKLYLEKNLCYHV